MPIIPPSTAAPYDTAEYVLNLARAIANDAALTIDGNLLADDQPYTYVLLNQAWRTLQRKLANSGYERLLREAVLTGFAPVLIPDPALQVYVNWSEYWNGSNVYDSPVLPQDLILPLRLWERPTGTTSQFQP